MKEVVKDNNMEKSVKVVKYIEAIKIKNKTYELIKDEDLQHEYQKLCRIFKEPITYFKYDDEKLLYDKKNNLVYGKYNYGNHYSFCKLDKYIRDELILQGVNIDDNYLPEINEEKYPSLKYLNRKIVDKIQEISTRLDSAECFYYNVMGYGEIEHSNLMYKLINYIYNFTNGKVYFKDGYFLLKNPNLKSGEKEEKLGKLEKIYNESPCNYDMLCLMNDIIGYNVGYIDFINSNISKFIEKIQDILPFKITDDFAKDFPENKKFVLMSLHVIKKNNLK